MKKGMKNFLSVMGALALLAGIGVGVYYGNGTVHKWTDEQVNKWKTGNSADTSTSSTPTSADSSKPVDSSSQGGTSTSSDGKLGLLFPKGQVFNKANVNDTLTCVATISPANVSFKTLNWTCGDTTSVGLASATTESGGTQTLTLLKTFSGNVTITVTSALDSKISTSFKVSIKNFITDASFVGISFDYDGTIYNIGKGQSKVTNGYYFAVSSAGLLTCSIPSLDDNCLLKYCFNVETFSGDLVGLPSAITSSKNQSFSSSNIFSNLELYCPGLSASGSSLSTTGASIDYGTVDGVSFTVPTAAFVAPTSITGLGDVSF